MSQRSVWIAVGAVAVLVLGGGGCCCALGGGVFWLGASAGDADADDARAQRDGFEQGPAMSGDECFHTALGRRMACGGSVDPNCGIQATTFLTACLQSSTRVDPSLCAEVPLEGFLASVEWSGRVCGELGYEPGSACEDVTPGIEAYCRSR